MEKLDAGAMTKRPIADVFVILDSDDDDDCKVIDLTRMSLRTGRMPATALPGSGIGISNHSTTKTTTTTTNMNKCTSSSANTAASGSSRYTDGERSGLPAIRLKQSAPSVNRKVHARLKPSPAKRRPPIVSPAPPTTALVEQNLTGALPVDAAELFSVVPAIADTLDMVHAFRAPVVSASGRPLNPEVSLQSLLDIVSENADNALDGVEELKRKYGPSGAPKNLLVTLHEHQLEGLAWMMKMENSEMNGGILADDMGLGKTIQTLALIVANKPALSEKVRGTLIVCPVSLMRQWQREIETKSKGLSVLIHHGPNRTKSKLTLREYDVVLTSYAMVTNERARREAYDANNILIQEEVKAGPLFRARWYRVILDEAHYVKNRNGAASLACAELPALKRFCLTGTPIQNSADEVYSLFRFIRLPHFAKYAYFQEKIGALVRLRSVQQHDQEHILGISRLQAVLKSCLLRRTKRSKCRSNGGPIISLPMREVTIVAIDLRENERDFYEALQGDALDKFNDMDKRGDVMKNLINVLIMILRLRQACCHPKLVREVYQRFNGGRGGDLQGIIGRALKGAACAAAGQENGGRSESVGRRELLFRAFSVNLDSELLVSSDEENQVVKAYGREKEAVAGEAKSATSIGLKKAKGIMSSDVFERVMRLMNLDEGGLLEEECAICADVMGEPVITQCGHAFCQECISGYLSHVLAHERRGEDENDENSIRPCPTCRADISSCTMTNATVFINLVGEPTGELDSDVEILDIKKAIEIADDDYGAASAIFEQATSSSEEPTGIIVTGEFATGATEKPDAPAPLKKEMTMEECMNLLQKAMTSLHPDGNYMKFISSSKLDKMTDILRDIDEENPNLKTVIFSQFTSMLDLAEIQLCNHGMDKFVRYDGTMSVKQKSDAVDTFFTDPDIPIMLVSLKAGSVGLNLTRASRVIMLDVWWNPAVEDQAIDRVHRIGQVLPVKVYRLTIKNSIEDRILMLQENKRAIAAGALGEGDVKVGRLSLRDLRFLFTNNSTFLAPVPAPPGGLAPEAAALVLEPSPAELPAPVSQHAL
ncbi:SNF2 family N-terminal domain-containing protein [Chytriomyces sp. MP71]|nr:SNF2 family N-terminal domain-containing protein [Chytriomyces sp. MP71]